MERFVTGVREWSFCTKPFRTVQVKENGFTLLLETSVVKTNFQMSQLLCVMKLTTYRTHVTKQLLEACYTRSGWYKHIEPHRTYTNHTFTELARCVGCLCTSSGWFKHSEPTRTTHSQTSTELARCVGYFYSSSGWFKHIEPHRTYTNHTITEIARDSKMTKTKAVLV